MRQLEYHRAGSPATDEQIQLLVNRFGVDLPAEIEEWLRTHNGMNPTDDNNGASAK